MSTNKQKKDPKKFWVRLLCVVLVILMAGSSLLSLLGIFEY